jgi:glycosyltransferase involved in cell wall biosynthesis
MSMRIALLCHKFWPAVGGLCTYTGRLAEYLIERGHEVHVLTTQIPRSEPRFQRVGTSMTIRRFTPRLANHPPFHFMPGMAAASFSRALRTADIFHSVGYYFFPTVLAHVLGSLYRTPHVCTPSFGFTPESWQRAWFDNVMGRRILRTASHVIVQSQHELDVLRQHRFTLGSHSIVPFGVEVPLFTADYDVGDLRARVGLREGEYVALFVGKIMSPKGAFHCLEVAARLRASGMRLRLIMIGDVHERERHTFLARMRELELDDAVTLTGPITDRTEIARYYQLADAVLFPSQYEQFGIVAIEAGASGRPLVGTPVGIMQSIVPETGYGLLHPFGDLDAFTINLRDVLTTPRYRENAARHRGRFLREYGWRRIAERTEMVYATLLGGRRAG